MGINDASMLQRNLQKDITALLQQNPNLIQQSVSRASSLAMVQKDILMTLREQGAIMNANAVIAARTVPMAIRSGITTGRHGGYKAAGHIPETNRSKAAQERFNAFAAGYVLGAVKSMPMKGVGRVTYNTAETVQHLGGFSQPFISPPKNSAAGRAHKAASVRKTGIDPYAADGFVPNFNMMNLYRGITGGRASVGAPLTEAQALSGPMGVFQGRTLMTGMPQNPKSFSRHFKGT